MFVCFFHHNFHCPPCMLLGWQRFLSTTPLRYRKAYYSISQYDHRGINHSQYRGCTLLFEATITYQKSSTRAKRYNGRPIIDVVRCALLLCCLLAVRKAGSAPWRSVEHTEAAGFFFSRHRATARKGSVVGLRAWIHRRNRKR